MYALATPTSAPNRVVYDDLQPCKLPAGRMSAICIYADDLAQGFVTFCPTDESSARLIATLSAKIEAHVTNSPSAPPHCPVLKEVCLALFEDTYYRAVCTESSEGGYSMFFIDYGNTEHGIQAEMIRELPKDLADYPVMCALCDLKGTHALRPYVGDVIMTSEF